MVNHQNGIKSKACYGVWCLLWCLVRILDSENYLNHLKYCLHGFVHTEQACTQWLALCKLQARFSHHWEMLLLIGHEEDNEDHRSTECKSSLF